MKNRHSYLSYLVPRCHGMTIATLRYATASRGTNILLLLLQYVYCDTRASDDVRWRSRGRRIKSRRLREKFIIQDDTRTRIDILQAQRTALVIRHSARHYNDMPMYHILSLRAGASANGYHRPHLQNESSSSTRL